MSYQWFIGIDVSKQTLDITILNNSEKKMYEQIINSDQSIKSFRPLLVFRRQILPAKSQYTAVVRGSCGWFCSQANTSNPKERQEIKISKTFLILDIAIHDRLVKKYISSLKILLDKGFRAFKFQTI